MKFFLKHQKVILRTLGAFLLVMGATLFFWAAPQSVLSENERAAANLARMEHSVHSSTSSYAKSKHSNNKVISKSMVETQKKQLRMLMILVMIFGAGFLGYSFLNKENKE